MAAETRILGVVEDMETLLHEDEAPCEISINAMAGNSSFSTIRLPLTELLKKGSFQWDPAADKAFVNLKAAMASTLMLTLPDYKQPFMIEDDARDVGIGVVLMQQGRPLTYLSKGMSPKHQKLST
ncbi:hypothetical protein AgCh_019409 [Apium graveolens]